ncbi:uncharacterized protein [Typha angustifolia]|uniref:uncharacterized protein n=1 Tax=Typha angustifolia TaxID=59011 RepID=UPI003C30B0CC
MASTLMATTSILLCSGLAAMLSSTSTIKKPLDDTLYGAHGELAMAVKYAALLLLFLLAFLCYSFSISFMSQVGFLVNIPQCTTTTSSTGEYVCGLMEKGFGLSTVGNRVFYAALPLLLWVFGPVLVFFCYVLITLMLYCVDNVACGERKVGGKDEEIMDGNKSLLV